MKKLVVLFALLLSVGSIYGQKRLDRHSVYAGVGGNLFMGDLGGGSQDAAHILGLRDCDLKAFRPSATLGYAYKVYDNLTVRGQYMYSRVSGSDNETERITRERRNLNFRSNLNAFGASADYYFLTEKDMPRYGVTSITKRLAAYVSIGLNYITFNPQGEYEGEWYNLQPLCTEGQGTNVTYIKKVKGKPDETVTTSSAPYKLQAFEIPMGLGMKLALNRKVSVGMEIAYHLTTTDYIDDCSTNYFNYEQEGLTPPSEMTNLLANKRVNSEGVAMDMPNTGATRGNSGYNDAYVTLMFTAHYKIISSYGKHRRKIF